MLNDSMGDRMKRYEKSQKTFHAPNTPLFVRVDGRAFHTLTKHCNKPFDKNFMSSMKQAAIAVADQLSGYCIAIYVQSDEATFVLQDWETYGSEQFFGGNQQKICSIVASAMSVDFSQYYGQIGLFDARSFSVPPHEVTNALLWRMKDWYRNSINMIGQSQFTFSELQKKSVANVITMLEEKNGVGWLESTFIDVERWGLFWCKNSDIVFQRFDYESLAKLIDPLLPK